MSTMARTPKILKAGIVLIDPSSGAMQRLIAMQYNPETLSRTFQMQELASDGGNRSEAMRIKGPPVETINLDAEIDATDQLEFPKDNPQTVENGIYSALAALETLIYPESSKLQSNHDLAATGTLEIIAMEQPLSLFVWSKQRVLPVRITDLSITEEAFDADLNPIRAKVSLGMRVLTVDDLGFDHRGGQLFMGYLQGKEAFMREFEQGQINQLGVDQLP
jgi:hypothetical protein